VCIHNPRKCASPSILISFFVRPIYSHYLSRLLTGSELDHLFVTDASESILPCYFSYRHPAPKPLSCYVLYPNETISPNQTEQQLSMDIVCRDFQETIILGKSIKLVRAVVDQTKLPHSNRFNQNVDQARSTS
jgi:hypothetical protein